MRKVTAPILQSMQDRVLVKCKRGAMWERSNWTTQPSRSSSKEWTLLPKSPLEEDSVKLGVPSVHVGVLPSIDRGGVHTWLRPWATITWVLLSTPNVTRPSPRDSNCTSLTLNWTFNVSHSKLCTPTLSLSIPR